MGIVPPGRVVHCLGVLTQGRRRCRLSIASVAVSCAMGASCSSGSATPPRVADDKAVPVAEAPKPSEPTGAPIAGDAIRSWFEARGAKMPGALNPAETECRTVSAPVPSGQGLWCEQRSSMMPWVQMTRTVLYDVRQGRTLLLVNLLSRVSAGDAAPGSGCRGALVALKTELGSDGRSLTVADAPECACAGAADRLASRAASSRDEGKMTNGDALEHQSGQVQAACAQLGAYKWDEHGFVPAK
jgi:hypothetical protein